MTNFEKAMEVGKYLGLVICHNPSNDYFIIYNKKVVTNVHYMVSKSFLNHGHFLLSLYNKKDNHKFATIYDKMSLTELCAFMELIEKIDRSVVRNRKPIKDIIQKIEQKKFNE